MFENLIESKYRRQTPVGQSLISLGLHVVLVAGAVQATAGAVEKVREIAVDTTMIFLKPPDATPPPPPEQVVVVINPPPQGFQLVVPPENIPTEIPPVNLNERFDPKDFTGKGVEGGIATGVVGGTGPVPSIGNVFLAAEVDEIPQAICAQKPKYPPVMEQAGIPGKVMLQFIVDTTGHAELSSVKVVKSTHKAFEENARDAVIKGCTFKPGRSRGKAVRVLVQQPVSFNPPQ